MQYSKNYHRHKSIASSLKFILVILLTVYPASKKVSNLSLFLNKKLFLYIKRKAVSISRTKNIHIMYRLYLYILVFIGKLRKREKIYGIKKNSGIV